MLKIRLKRVGRKHDPSYRVVLIDSHKGPKSGKINENLGFYDPRRDIKELKADAIKDWISKGAQVSDTVHNILIDQKVIEGKKINVLPRKSPQGDSRINADETQIDADGKIKEEAEAPKEEIQAKELNQSAEEEKKEDSK